MKNPIQQRIAQLEDQLEHIKSLPPSYARETAIAESLDDAGNLSADIEIRMSISKQTFSALNVKLSTAGSAKEMNEIGRLIEEEDDLLKSTRAAKAQTTSLWSEFVREWFQSLPKRQQKSFLESLNN